MPASVCGTPAASTPRGRRPRRAACSMQRRGCAVVRTTRWTLAAIVGPMPSTAARSSSVADDDARRDARTCEPAASAPAPPEVPDAERRSTGWRAAACFDASIAPSRLATEISPKPSSDEQVLRRSGSRCRRGRATRPALLKRYTVRSPRPSMSIAPRDAKWTMRWSRWAGHSGCGAEVSLSPSSARERARERARAGLREHPRLRTLRALGQHRPDDLGDDVAGLAHDDRVAGPHVLEPHLVLVVQRGEADRRPADEHRLEHGERRRLPGATDRHHDVVQRRAVPRAGTCRRSPSAAPWLVAAELARVARGRRPSRRRRRSRTARSWRCSCQSRAVLVHRVEAVERADLGVHRQAERLAGMRASRGGS